MIVPLGAEKGCWASQSMGTPVYSPDLRAITLTECMVAAPSQPAFVGDLAGIWAEGCCDEGGSWDG